MKKAKKTCLNVFRQYLTEEELDVGTLVSWKAKAKLCHVIILSVYINLITKYLYLLAIS